MMNKELIITEFKDAMEVADRGLRNARNHDEAWKYLSQLYSRLRSIYKVIAIEEAKHDPNYI